MAGVSVIVCTHNPRRDYLSRALAALDSQTLPKSSWELLLVDNRSRDKLADTWDLAWHPDAKHVREETLGLTPARLRGIEESRGELLIFVDDDNVLRGNYLEQALSIYQRRPLAGAYGPGVLVPEFEIEPPRETTPYLSMLALRNVPSAKWTTDRADYESIPWGAGLCVRRSVARSCAQLVRSLEMITPLLDRRGTELFSGGDDLFSWVAPPLGLEFGVVPDLQVTHLIPRFRLNQRYFRKLVHDHAFSSTIRHYVLGGNQPRRVGPLRYARLPLHAVKNGLFSMRCQWAELRGEAQAARFILNARLKPVAR